MADSSLSVSVRSLPAAFRQAAAKFLFKAGDDSPHLGRLMKWKDWADEVLLAVQGGETADLRTVFQRLAPTSTTDDGVAVELGSADIPANALGRVTGKFSGSMTVGTGGGDTVTFSLDFGGTPIDLVVTDTDLTIASYVWTVEFELANTVNTGLVGGYVKVALALASGAPGAAVTAQLSITEAVDTTADWTVTLSATASDDSDMGVACGYGNIALARV